MTKQNTILFLGLGYTARYLRTLMLEAGWQCLTLSTREKQNIAPEYLNMVTHILATAPPVKEQDPAIDLYSNLIINHVPHLKWLGYLSATSVYGDHKGDIVTEKTRCNPKSLRGKSRFNVEKTWQRMALRYQLPLHIFRLAGIYGKDRNTINDVRLGLGLNIIKQNHLTNRIYVKDIARILYASMQRPMPLEIFNLADDLPASTTALNDYVAFLLDKPQLKKVPYEDYAQNLSKMRQSFYKESKIVSNQKIKDTLGITLEYPTYREGIADILMHELMHKDAQIH